MAAARGRLSEGIDYKDGLARCILLVGVPNLNTKIDQIQAKMDYLFNYKYRLLTEKGRQPGVQPEMEAKNFVVNWCIAQTIRAIN